jgi:hypothetical protein
MVKKQTSFNQYIDLFHYKKKYTYILSFPFIWLYIVYTTLYLYQFLATFLMLFYCLGCVCLRVYGLGAVGDMKFIVNPKRGVHTFVWKALSMKIKASHENIRKFFVAIVSWHFICIISIKTLLSCFHKGWLASAFDVTFKK